MTRTSTSIVFVLPTRSSFRSSRTRSTLAWVSGAMSPISSRKIVPPSAASKRPMRRLSAPVNAPFSCPKSSLSTSSRLIAAQLTATKGLCLRVLVSWIAWATSSLPVPLSPRISTVRSVSATFWIVSKTRRIPAPEPIRFANPYSRWICSRSSRFSRSRRWRSRRAAHHDAQLVVVEGLRHVVLGAGLHRLDGDLLGAVGGDHHHGGLGAQLLGDPQDVHAARTAPEREIGQHQVEDLRPQRSIAASPVSASSTS